MSASFSDEFNRQLQAATIRVAGMDEIDGFKDRNLGTIEAALACGLNRPETEAAFDALVMLREVAYPGRVW